MFIFYFFLIKLKLNKVLNICFNENLVISLENCDEILHILEENVRDKNKKSDKLNEKKLLNNYFNELKMLMTSQLNDQKEVFEDLQKISSNFQFIKK